MGWRGGKAAVRSENGHLIRSLQGPYSEPPYFLSSEPCSSCGTSVREKAGHGSHTGLATLRLEALSWIHSGFGRVCARAGMYRKQFFFQQVTARRCDCLTVGGPNARRLPLPA